MSFGGELLNLLTKKLNTYIVIVLKDGSEYRGKLIGCDHLMNIALEEAVEFLDGQPAKSYGKVLLRGNNIIYIILGVI
jgi:small nuclear ribonucleoprotein